MQYCLLMYFRVDQHPLFDRYLWLVYTSGTEVDPPGVAPAQLVVPGLPSVLSPAKPCWNGFTGKQEAAQDPQTNFSSTVD